VLRDLRQPDEMMAHVTVSVAGGPTHGHSLPTPHLLSAEPSRDTGELGEPPVSPAGCPLLWGDSRADGR
jgi:hypothetical protein